MADGLCADGQNGKGGRAKPSLTKAYVYGCRAFWHGSFL